MQGNDSYLMNCGGPLVKVNTKMQKYADTEEPGVFCVKRCITYSQGKRFLSLNITEKSKDDLVNSVHIDVAEESGTGSSANMSLRFVRNNRYGVLSRTHTKLSGSYGLDKQNFCVPPLPETEVTCYYCRETCDGSFFTVEKMKGLNNSGVVERVKGTHAFIVGDETLSVKVKITNDKIVGLRVEVDPPVKLTVDYSFRAFEKIEDKMESGMTNVLTPMRNASAQLSPVLSPVKKPTSQRPPNRPDYEDSDPISKPNPVRVSHEESMFHGPT